MATQNHSGLLPGYETTFITKSEMSDEALKALKDRLTSVVSQYNGELVLTEDWGKRKLAYPISKEVRGQYTYFVYTGKGDIVHEMERNLRLNDQVIRFNAEGFKKSRVEQQAAAKKREEEREARREERAGYSDRRYRQDSVERPSDVAAISDSEEEV
ncbi:30S ribosomal protein S6 [bacterium]|nr:30S ribosomal protein S6 [bacterium]